MEKFIYLIVTILLTATLFAIFKFFQKWKVNTFNAIVINYFTCVITGLFFLPDLSQLKVIHLDEPWFYSATLLGLLFISTFYLMAYATQKISMTVSSVASKMSLVLTVLFNIIYLHLPGQFLNSFNVLGLLLSIPAIILTSYKPSVGKKENINFGLPIAIFLCTGLIDILLSYTKSQFINTETLNRIFPILTFLFATVFGLLIFISRSIKNGWNLSWRDIGSGILLGIPNYFSIYFLLLTLEAFQNNGALVFPLSNMGVIGVSSLIGILLFKEKFQLKNYIGIIIAVLALALLIL